MQTQISPVDAAQSLGTAFKGSPRSGSGNPFEEIMAQLTQATVSSGTAAPVRARQAVTATDTETNDPLAVQDSPIQRLGQALRASGQSLEGCQVAAADRDKLEQVLVQSGYRRQDARQLMERASNPDGSVNLGTLFANLSQYLPIQGPQLLLSQEDAPLLIQVLKDLGIDQGKVQEFMDNLPKQGDKLVVQGLPELLAQADPQQTKGVDQSILSDLLGRLGLGQAQVQALVSRGTDNQGATTPQAVMALFTVAAQRQEQGQGQSLEDLVSRLQLAKNSQSKANSADQIRAKVIQTLQKIEAQVSSQTQSLSRHWQQAMEQSQAILSGQAPGQGQGQGQGLALGQGQGLALGQGLGQGNDQGLALGQGLEQGQGLAGLFRQALQNESASLAQPEMARSEAQAMAVKLAGHAVAGSQALAAGQAGSQTATDGTAEAAPGGQAAEQIAKSEAAQAVTARPVTKGQEVAGLGALASGQAQADEMAPARPSLPAYVVRQVGQQIAQMVTRQENSMRLELKPPSLGEVSLELSVKDGVVKATMLTDTMAAKHILETGLDQLKQQLDMQGLKVEQVEILVNPDAQRHEAQAQAGFGQQRRRGSGGRGEDGAGAAVEGLQSLDSALPGSSAGSGRINLFA